MKDGIHIFKRKAGAQKGENTVHLVASGRIIATNGEGHLNLSQCQSWPLRVFKRLFKIGVCRAWAAKQFGLNEQW